MPNSTYHGMHEPSLRHPLGLSAAGLRRVWRTRSLAVMGLMGVVAWITSSWRWALWGSIVGVTMMAWSAWQLRRCAHAAHEVAWCMPVNAPSWIPWQGFSHDLMVYESVVANAWAAMRPEFEFLVTQGYRLEWAMVERRHAASPWLHDNTGPTMLNVPTRQTMQLWLNLRELHHVRRALIRQGSGGMGQHDESVVWGLDVLLHHVIHHEMGHALCWNRMTAHGSVLDEETWADVWGLMQGFQHDSASLFQQHVAALSHLRSRGPRHHRTDPILR